MPSVNRREAISAAGTHFEVAAQKAPTTRLVVYARGKAIPTLAYEVRYVGVKKDQTPTDMRFIVDAHTGQLLDKWDTIHTAGPGRDPRTCDTASSGTGTGCSIAGVTHVAVALGRSPLLDALGRDSPEHDRQRRGSDGAWPDSACIRRVHHGRNSGPAAGWRR